MFIFNGLNNQNYFYSMHSDLILFMYTCRVYISTIASSLQYLSWVSCGANASPEGQTPAGGGQSLPSLEWPPCNPTQRMPSPSQTPGTPYSVCIVEVHVKYYYRGGSRGVQFTLIMWHQMYIVVLTCLTSISAYSCCTTGLCIQGEYIFSIYLNMYIVYTSTCSDSSDSCDSQIEVLHMYSSATVMLFCCLSSSFNLPAQ